MTNETDEVAVQSFRVVTYGELAPLLDALDGKARTVSSLRHGFDAPMAQPTAALVLSFVMPIMEAGLARIILTELTKDGYRIVRDQFLGLLRRIKERDHMGNYWEYGQGAIEVGQLRFHVGAGITDEEFCRRIQRAQDVVNNLPRFVTKGAAGQGVYAFWWDEDADVWRGNPS
jgi:hypothetical protein